ncbi:GPI ethanolamine phosphate transferase 3 [Musca vetustissima]|uniref:GPI ethanolamine phosphate transferase 3 n=1 Tax=Musca vetustissima TaxID=27455 RepID=UPI002AB6BBFB|nr:GPI ethanolamine phosphate transferase 3 [Musca vetustissima]
MKFALSYVLMLAWIAYLISSGVYLFSRGFLLSRVSKTDVSSCRHLSTDPNDEYFLTEAVVDEIFKDVNASSNLCLPQKSKVIILLIDALKYDFGVYKENVTEPLPYENKLGVLNDLINNEPHHARLMRFKADPPTTTLQRLKGLTTGSLPTFVDIGSNFASPEINEDNIIDQMVKSHLPIVFMGDSTWTDLYPNRFKRSYSYPSFDIFDLDTIDRKIEKHLPKELQKEDWQVLIAHFLGVDHCGHKHGPLHEEMSRKLKEMNDIIRNVVSQMSDDTTLLVMGDHGMTISGDHGGDSNDETNALLFAYTKKTNFLNGEYGSDTDVMQQIDLVPTLATILGIPIPYSNLGLINFNIVPDVAVPHMTKLQSLILHVWQNAQQIYTYFYNYAVENKRSFNVEEMDRMDTEFILLTHRVKSIYNEAAFKSFIGDLNVHLRQILSTCRELWVKFDATQMSQGLLVTFFSVFFSFILITNTPAGKLSNIFTAKELGYTYLLNIAAGVFGYRYYKNFSFKTEEHAIIFFTNVISSLILVFHMVQNWYIIALSWSKVKRFVNMPTRAVLIILMSICYSNSFVVNEGHVLSYLLVCVIILMAYELLQKSIRVDFKTKFKPHQFLKSTAFKLLLASILAVSLIRFATTFFRCREEQGNCMDFTNNSSAGGFSLKRPSSAKSYILSIVIVVLYTTLSRIYLRSCGNLTGMSANILMARYGPTVASICAGGHILLSNSAIKNIDRTHIDMMALVVYALLVIQIIVVTISPLMVFVLPQKNKSSISVRNTDSIIPEIFKKMKSMYQGDDAERRSDIPVVYGLATIYSSVLISFGTFLTMVLVILLEPKSCSGIVVCIAVAAIILSLHAILRYRTAVNFETCLQPTFTAIVGWFLLGHFCFFATSHQTTLSQIDWRAAFVGRSTNIGQSHFISGILVILNTFCGHILFSSMYVLLSTETFSIFALFPTLIKTNANRERKVEGNNTAKSTSSTYDRSLSEISNECVGFDMTRGELVLFENENVFIATLFKVAIQLYILQGTKIFCAMLACTIHCRHLMVWKIFAPRFIYESIATFVSLPAIIIGFLLILRIHKGVERLISKINKDK